MTRAEDVELMHRLVQQAMRLERCVRDPGTVLVAFVVSHETAGQLWNAVRRSDYMMDRPADEEGMLYPVSLRSEMPSGQLLGRPLRARSYDVQDGVLQGVLQVLEAGDRG